MTGQSLRIANVDQPFDHRERIVEFHTGIEAPLNAKRQQRGWSSAAILVCQAMVIVRFKTTKIHPVDPSMRFKKLRHCKSILTMALHAKTERFQPLQEQESIDRRQC